MYQGTKEQFTRGIRSIQCRVDNLRGSGMILSHISIRNQELEQLNPWFCIKAIPRISESSDP